MARNFPWLSGLMHLLWPAGPARRKRWLLAAMVILLVMLVHTAWLIVAGVRLANTAEEVAENWGTSSPSSLAPPAVEDWENAARPVRAAAELVALPARVVGQPIGLTVRAYGTYQGKAPNRQQLRALQGVVEQNELTLTILDEATRRPAASWDLHYERGIGIQLPDLLRLLDLARLNVTAGRLAIDIGNDEAVADALVRGVAIQDSLANEPILMIQMTRLAIQRINAALLREWLTSHKPMQPSLERVMAALSPDRDMSLQRAIVGDAIVMLDGVLSGGSRDFTSAPWKAGGVLEACIGWVVQPYLLENARYYLEVISEVAECASTPRWQRASTCNGSAGSSPYYALAQTMFINFAEAVERSDRARSRERLSRIALALEKAVFLTGQYPEHLDSIVDMPDPSSTLEGQDQRGGAVDAEMLVDPLTGKEFVYRLFDDGYELRAPGWSEAQADRGVEPDPILAWSIRR